ncbi:MAG TPA: metallopeptidase family protein [Candidatus Paceibacterota bacterium]
MHDPEYKKFEKMVAEAYDKLPEWVRRQMNNIAITIEDFVDSDTAQKMNLDSHMDLLGLYKGIPLTDREHSAGISFPDTVTLYRMPILDEADVSGKPVEQVIFETLWHEVAHHFGLTESQVEAREREEFGN